MAAPHEEAFEDIINSVEDIPAYPRYYIQVVGSMPVEQYIALTRVGTIVAYAIGHSGTGNQPMREQLERSLTSQGAALP